MKVYISYTRDLERHAERLAQELPGYDLDPLMDKQSVRPGMNWNSAAQDMLRSADAFVVLVGTEPTSWLDREWSWIVEESWRRPATPIVPVVLEGCTPPAFLRERQAIPLRKGARLDRPRFLHSIAAALREETAEEPAPKIAKERRANQQQRLQTLEEQAKELQPTAEDLRHQARNLEALLAQQQEEDSPEVANTATRLADVMKSLNEPKRILQYQQLALDSLEKFEQEASADVARAHANLATTLQSLGEHSDALEHLQTASSLYREAVGPKTMAVAMSEMRLATALRDLGQAEAAEAHTQASQEALKAASWNFVTELPVIGPLIRRVAEKERRHRKRPRKKVAAKSKKGVTRKKVATTKAARKKSSTEARKAASAASSKKKKITRKKTSRKKQASRKKKTTRKVGTAKRRGRKS